MYHLREIRVVMLRYGIRGWSGHGDET
jgi:hypothetical protein